MAPDKIIAVDPLTIQDRDKVIELLKVLEKHWSRNEELENLNKMMEEMANAPKEEYGKRQPGERGMYETKRNFSE